MSANKQINYIQTKDAIRNWRTDQQVNLLLKAVIIANKGTGGKGNVKREN